MSVAALPRPLAAPAARPAVRWSSLLLKGLPLLLGIIIVVPLVLLLINSFNVAGVAKSPTYGLGNWVQAFADQATVGALLNSLSLALVRTAISMPFGILLAWLVARTDMPGRSLVELLAWLSIFTPILPLTLGWILLLDPRFGLINSILNVFPFWHGHEFNVYGFWGITWVYLASNSIAFKVVLLVPAFRRVGAAIEDAARMCGASMWKATLRITLPLLLPAILLVMLITLVFSFEGFEVELLLGEPVRFFVYSTRIYDLVTNQPPYVGEATAVGFVFLVWLVGLTILYQWFIRNRTYTTVTGSGYISRPIRLGNWRWVATAGSLGFFAISIGLPFTLLVMGSFMRLYGFFNVQNAFTAAHWHELFSDPAFTVGVRNSLIISAVTAVVVIVLYSIVAYAILRSNSWALKITDRLVWAPWAMPGILMSLGLLWFYLATPARTLLYGSLAGIIVAFIIRGSPLSTQFFKTSLLQIGRELEDGARICGASWHYMYRRILLRLLAPTAVTVGLLSFLQSMYDISTPVLLYTTKSRPLSLLMLEYAFSGARERGAAIGVIITSFVMIVLLLSRSFGYRLSRDRL
ncbi:MAG TPA: ABC transporter permease subunit [Chloroflexota bacterium]|nr:ABC transporter permease subunit [Chloroflexota bacterium]